MIKTFWPATVVILSVAANSFAATLQQGEWKGFIHYPNTKKAFVLHITTEGRFISGLHNDGSVVEVSKLKLEANTLTFQYKRQLSDGDTHLYKCALKNSDEHVENFKDHCKTEQDEKGRKVTLEASIVSEGEADVETEENEKEDTAKDDPAE